MKLVVRHDPGGGRFVASIGGEEATLLYTEAGARTLDFTRTYVPDALRHQKSAKPSSDTPSPTPPGTASR